MSARPWHLYLLECDGRAIYTGITTDVERRLAEHTAGLSRAARYTRGVREFRLLYTVELGERTLTARAEYRLKQLPRNTKMQIVEDQPGPEDLLKLLDLTI